MARPAGLANRPPDLRLYAASAAHELCCGRKMSIRRAQRVMRDALGLRRSVGGIHADLKAYECSRCTPKPQVRARAIAWWS